MLHSGLCVSTAIQHTGACRYYMTISLAGRRCIP